MLVADLLAAAAVALGFGGYLGHLAGTPVVVNALLLLALVALTLHAGISTSVWLAIGLTVVEAAGLLVVIVLGLPRWSATSYVEMPEGLPGVWAGAALIFFAYLGFDELGNFAEEMRAPERDLPRALLLSLVITTGIYVLVALSAVAAVGWRDLSTSSAPLALVARRALGARADTVLALMALAATANTVLLLVLSGSRLHLRNGGGGLAPASAGPHRGSRHARHGDLDRARDHRPRRRHRRPRAGRHHDRRGGARQLHARQRQPAVAGPGAPRRREPTPRRGPRHPRGRSW